MEDIGVYAFSFENPERKKRLLERAKTIGITINMVPCVYETDKRVQMILKITKDSRLATISFNHMDMIIRFLRDQKKKYGIFCEDDIYLRKSFIKDIAIIKEEFERLKLDVLLLGYLLPYCPNNIPIIDDSYSYHSYEDDLWGAHCYMLSKIQAKKIVEKYNVYNILKMKTPFSPDWIFTKNGKRAFVWPPLAIEEGDVKTTHQGHIEFHKRCAQFLYNPQYYI